MCGSWWILTRSSCKLQKHMCASTNIAVYIYIHVIVAIVANRHTRTQKGATSSVQPWCPMLPGCSLRATFHALLCFRSSSVPPRMSEFTGASIGPLSVGPSIQGQQELPLIIRGWIWVAVLVLADAGLVHEAGRDAGGCLWSESWQTKLKRVTRALEPGLQALHDPKNPTAEELKTQEVRKRWATLNLSSTPSLFDPVLRCFTIGLRW